MTGHMRNSMTGVTPIQNYYWSKNGFMIIRKANDMLKLPSNMVRKPLEKQNNIHADMCTALYVIFHWLY